MMYENFAYMYDRLTDDVDYDSFVNLIDTKIKKYKPDSKLVLELACGTGNITKRMSDKGFDMIGLDLSVDMLEVARSKCPDVLLLNQDMTDFELYGTVDVIICCLDSINYITDKRMLKRMFKLVNNYLNYGGLFIFDINSEYKLKNIVGNNCFVRNEEELFYSWENELLKDRVNFYLTFFAKNEKDAYEKTEEMHTERIYKEQELITLLKDAKMKYLESVYDFSDRKTSKKAERIFIIASKDCLDR